MRSSRRSASPRSSFRITQLTKMPEGQATSVAMQRKPIAQELVGEELVDASNAYAFADRMRVEADRIWASPSSDWRLISTSRDVLNEGAQVSGAFGRSGIEITRASAIVDASADALFELLASPAGYALIDPFTDPKDHEKPPLEVFDAANWPTTSSTDKPRRLEAANALAKIPLMTTREFVVLNAIDYNTRYFLSKSIQHAASPGTSAFGPDGYVPPANGNVRALNTFGVQIEPLEGEEQRKCVVKLLNFADIGGKVPVFFSNLANKNFLVDLVTRMRKAMANNAAPTQPLS